MHHWVVVVVVDLADHSLEEEEEDIHSLPLRIQHVAAVTHRMMIDRVVADPGEEEEDDHGKDHTVVVAVVKGSTDDDPDNGLVVGVAVVLQ